MSTPIPGPETTTAGPDAADDGGSLDTFDRMSALFYGVILVLTFTVTLRVVAQSRHDVDDVLWTLIGCAVAWGSVDGVMFVMARLATRNRAEYLLRTIREDPAVAQAVIRDELPPVVVNALSEAELQRLADSLARLPPRRRDRLTKGDFLGGLQVFGLATAALLPVAAPFAFLKDLTTAQGASDAVALAMMFLAGCRVARYTGGKPIVTGLRALAVGVALVLLAMAFGG